MPSNRFTKINIDRDVYELIKVLAAARGTSTAKLLEEIILSYLQHMNSNTSKGH